jgi:hypothetical protein
MWRKLLSLHENKRSTIQLCDNSRNLNAFRWRRWCQTRWIQKQRLLFIELIQSRAENEDETESESDHENKDDEIEDKQHRNKLSINTKTDDAKSKDALNRLRFIKLKSWKKSFLSKRKVFFEMRTRQEVLLALIRLADVNVAKFYLIRLANVNVIEEWCQLNRRWCQCNLKWCQRIITLNMNTCIKFY